MDEEVVCRVVGEDIVVATLRGKPRESAQVDLARPAHTLLTEARDLL